MSDSNATEANQSDTSTPATDSVALKPLADQGHTGTHAGVNLDALMDVQVNLTVEIGRATLPIRDLVSLNQGAVIHLDRKLSEPMDLLVNGTLIARGEVVVMGEKFGLRLLDIVSPSERIKKLK